MVWTYNIYMVQCFVSVREFIGRAKVGNRLPYYDWSSEIAKCFASTIENTSSHLDAAGRRADEMEALCPQQIWRQIICGEPLLLRDIFEGTMFVLAVAIPSTSGWRISFS